MSSKTSVNTIMNVVGGGAILLLVAYGAGTYYFSSAEPEGCIASYTRGATFGYRANDGRLLSAIEVQAQAGADERGLMENTRIVEADGIAATSALEVKLGRADATDPSSALGVDFAWRPVGLRAASAACLRYSVFLPDDFDFGSGGSLPGLFGGGQPPAEGETATEGFAIRPHWSRDAHGEVIADTPMLKEARDRLFGYRKLAFKRGRWATIEQEVRLNAPDSKDGVLKVWFNGQLVVEEDRMSLRDSAATTIAGVMARASFAGTGRGAPDSEHGLLRLSPLEMSWREDN
ncbi:MAG: polysaccharide lyase [Hyphomicrobiaceae bacterium]